MLPTNFIRKIIICLLASSLLLICFWSGPTIALDKQRALSEFSREAWLTENGLPQNTVHDIAQTREGYIWIATEGGLARFDGISFTVFEKQNTPQLKEGDIHALLADRQGGLWVCTTNGLLRMSGGKFISYTTQEGLPSNDIQSIHEDHEGNIWIGTPAGLTRFKDDLFSTLTTRDGLVSNDVKTLFEDGENALWVGTSDGLSRLKDGNFTSYTAPDGLASNSVAAISEDHNGQLWVGTFHGLSCLNAGRFTTYTIKDGLPNERITALRVDKEGSLWAGTAGGLARFEDGRFATFKPQDELSRNVILSIFEDVEGSLWVGTESGGLNFLKDRKFTTYGVADGLPNDLVKCVYEDHEDNVWVGTYGGGLGLLQDGKVTRTFTTEDGLSSNIVLALFDDTDGNLWVGTPDGLNRFKDGKFTIYTSADGLANDFVRSIYADKSGSLWIGTRGGLTRMKDGVFTTYTTEDGLPDDFVGTIDEDTQGNLWVGTLRGLSKFKDGKFTSYTTKDELPDDVVITLHKDAEGSLWIGTNGGGLSRLKDGKLTTYNTRDGLPDDVIYSIMEDGRGNLWLSCNKGIFQIDKRQLDEFTSGKINRIDPVTYGTADGMTTRECSGGGHPSGWKSRDGKLWFSTVKGVAMIDPSQLKINEQPPGVAIEQVRIDDESVAPYQKIELRPGKTRFDFYYTGLSFIAPGKVRFKYKLEGFDNTWVDGGARRIAYYTNLPPGEYKFRVMAANNDGVWNETGASFDFYLRPHFYQTYWFYALCALGIALIGWQLYRFRVRQVKRQFAAVLDERNRIAREIHDNLAQDILGISVQLELVSRTMPGGEEAARSHLDRARILVRSSIAEARRYVWDLRSQALESNDLPAALNETARRLTAETGVQAQVQVSGTFRPLTPLVESNLLRIGQEAINNAVKHARANRILVNLKFDSKHVQLSVRDDGHGFDVEKQSKNGHFGLVGMHERAEQMGGTLLIRSGPGEGTEVVVDVPVNV
jgi:ligand-binding sensor domain-containing protein/signal transduction histidine kinase